MLHRDETVRDAKLTAVREYLDGGQSLRATAVRHGISFKTLWFWVRAYRAGGPAALLRRPGRSRIPMNLAQRISRLKENDPGLTLREAGFILQRWRILVSKNTIWRVWCRDLLTRRSVNRSFTTFSLDNEEGRQRIAPAIEALRRGNTRQAAAVLNRLPYLPPTPVLAEIPDALLSPRRVLDKLYLEFERRFENTSFAEYAGRARRIGRELEKRGCRASSMLANFLELLALNWLGRPREKLRVHARLDGKMRRVRNPAHRFHFYHQLASTYLDLMMVEPAHAALRKCRQLLYSLPDAMLWEAFGDLQSRTLRNAHAHRAYQSALRFARDPAARDRIHLKLAGCLVVIGDLPRSVKLLKLARSMKDSTVFSGSYCLTNAYYHFIRGDLHRAREHYLTALNRSSREQVFNRLIASTIGLAAIAMALDQPREARTLLTKYLSLTVKYRMNREMLTLRYLAGRPVFRSSSGIHELPRMKLLALLQTARRTKKLADYRRAVRYAQNQGSAGFFFHHIVFYPELILTVLRKGKDPALPKSILQLPEFRRETPVYLLKFLGPPVVTRNGAYLAVHLSPKERSFLIHLALRAGSSGQSLPVDELCRNFWPRSPDASAALAHLLTRLKRKIKLPGHLLTVGTAAGLKRLVNNGFYLTTDYGEYQTLLTQIRSLLLTGEHQLAKREYLRAFRLFRGPVFRGSYDPWSDQLRSAVLNQLDAEFFRFRELCVKHAGLSGLAGISRRLNQIAPLIAVEK